MVVTVILSLAGHVYSSGGNTVLFVDFFFAIDSIESPDQFEQSIAYADAAAWDCIGKGGGQGFSFV